MPGGIRMVEIGGKPDVRRVAVAEGRIRLREETIRRLREGQIEKGDVLTTAQIAGILAAKRTPSIIPLCHPIPITNVKIDFRIEGREVVVTAEVRSVGKTGVEMEALTAASAALLTIWDMTKQYEKDESGQYPETAIREIRVIRKVKG